MRHNRSQKKDLELLAQQSPASQPVPQQDSPVQSFSIARQQYSGPIPPPSMMAQFNEVMPDGADRIMRMAEKQQDHRHHIEDVVIESDAAQSKRGTYSGTSCLITAYIVAGFLGYNGHDGAAIAIAGTVSVVFGGAYAAGLLSRRKELSSKEDTRTALRDNRR